jgi:hypothetical protein
MHVDRGTLLRAVLVVAMFASAGVVLDGALADRTETINRVDAGEHLGDRVGQDVAGSTSGWTVIATQGADNQGYSAELVALDESGELVYHNGTRDVYFDVDPHPSGAKNVLTVASTNREASTVNHIEVHNLSTGETRQLYAGVTPNVQHSRWHDVDRLNATHYVVAGIEADRVFVVDVATDEVVWQWNASQSFTLSSGGPPDDWTHLNDVEVLEDGRIMVSLRNQDQVVFLRRNGTVDEDWTLGADGNHSVMYEQHQPDYIPAENGGPAVVLADSENDRLVEYQRVDGEWVRTWTWRDEALNWPRDADRLPNGHTLAVDSLGDRVLEVDQNGDVVWSVAIGIPYDAERLGTGDESAGGPSARSAELVSRAPFDARISPAALLPAKVRHGMLWVVPGWMDPVDVLALAVYVVSLLALLGVEVGPRVARWRAE